MIIQMAIQKAEEAEKAGALNGMTKRQFAGKWLYHTNEVQEMLELQKLEEIWDYVDLLDEYYGEGCNVRSKMD